MARYLLHHKEVAMFQVAMLTGMWLVAILAIGATVRDFRRDVWGPENRYRQRR